MFPLRDHNPTGRVPVVTWALIVLNVAVFLRTAAILPEGPELARLYMTWGLVPRDLSSGANYAGLLGSMFLHESILHIGGNMLFLWILGDNLEDVLGRIGFLAFYLIGGVLAGLAQWAAGPWSPAPTIGASGAVAAVMGGYLLLFPRARVDVMLFLVVWVRILPLAAWTILAVWFAVQLAGALGSDATTGGIAYWSHVGGFVAGVLLMLPVWLVRGGTRSWRPGWPPHAPGNWGPVRRTTIPQVRRALRPARRGPWDR
ncbi:MAG: rhomboid family intramembrane serine protease [Rubellimicrobium sp.]|nr:rhomboid family intramembrane serine protease [Rubellimicrobium sp.]